MRREDKEWATEVMDEAERRVSSQPLPTLKDCIRLSSVEDGRRLVERKNGTWMRLASMSDGHEIWGGMDLGRSRVFFVPTEDGGECWLYAGRRLL